MCDRLSGFLLTSSVMVPERFEIGLKCKWRVDLRVISFASTKIYGVEEEPTSSKSTKGGPAAMSAALVPGRIRSVAPI